MYAVGFLPQTINLATYGVAIGMYANSLWPQINAKWFGIAALSVFFAINLCGVDVMAKVQKILVILLFVALGLFIVLGCLQLKNPVFEFTAPDFFLQWSIRILFRNHAVCIFNKRIFLHYELW